jgi:hypothetical protein
MKNKKRSFVMVLPAALSASCVLLHPKISYSERFKEGDKCFVTKFANPPGKTEVSCTAPIEPPAQGSGWCTVERAQDPTTKANVKCEKKR